MPSDHSQFMGFVSFYYLLYVHSKKYSFSLSLFKYLRSSYFYYLTAVIGIILSLMVVYSRVELGVHSWKQVIAGNITGCILGIIWHYFMELIRPSFESFDLYFEKLQNFIQSDFVLPKKSPAVDTTNEVECDEIDTNNDLNISDKLEAIESDGGSENELKND